MGKYYPESKVEIEGFMAKHYDRLMNILSFGSYSSFIKKAVERMEIRPADRLLDLGAGTGRNACLMMKHLSEEGELLGVDVSAEMVSMFEKMCAGFPNAKIVQARIDQPLQLEGRYDKAFISFVLHGFPQEVRETILDNAFENLKEGGQLFILDYSEFDYHKAPFYVKGFFKIVECPYAFDFIERDWKKILSDHGFVRFAKYPFFKGYVTLLAAGR